MAEVKKAEEKYEQVERVITEDVLVRPEGYDLFLTKEEAKGLRTLLGMGIDSDALRALGLNDLWVSLDMAGIYADLEFRFSQPARRRRPVQ